MLANIIAKRFRPLTSLRSFHNTAFNLSYPIGKTGRPLTAYIRFVSENRADLLKKEPNLTLPETGRRLGELWRALPESTRQTYKEDYQKAFNEWKAKQ